MLKIKTTKLNENPLFINFLNWEGDKFKIEQLLINIKTDFQDSESKIIVDNKIKELSDKYLNALEIFQKQFRVYILDVISTQNLSEEFLIWLSNAFKYISDELKIYVKDEEHTSKIKDSNGKWFEGLVCNNFILTFNYFGSSIIKQCPICDKFFAHKGKYAKYCSDVCKQKGLESK